MPKHAIGLLSLVLCQAAFSQVSVLTHHNDISRTGQNVNETILTPQNVNSQSFGLLSNLKLDGQVYAQPLYVPRLTLPTSGQHNVLFAATEHDSVYAFDADSGATLWQATMLDAAHGAATGATPEQSTCGEVSPELGITGTPVIDPTTNTMYFAAKTTENGLPIYRLHAIDITNGNERPNSPVVFSATLPNKTGTVAFDPSLHRQRPGLLLLNGMVYIAFGAICDTTPWHGWIFAYNATTLAKTSVYITTPDANGGGVWMSGAGIAADIPDPVGHPFGRMFVSTGNGDFDGATNFSDDVERFDLTNGVITYTDSFTPSNQAYLASDDLDVSAAGVLLLPDQAGPYPHLLIQAGKTGEVYVIDRDNMGGYHTADAVVQKITGIGGLWGTPAYWNGNFYYWGKQNYIRQFAINNGTLTQTAMGSEMNGLGSTRYPAGPTLSISANGNTNGIVWASDYDANVFYAYDASNVATLLYSAPLTSAVKFTTPTIVNGKVYLAGSKKISIYGLLPNQPDFSISSAPTSLTMTPTATATSAITVAPINSFTGAVTLSIGSLPAGVSASLSSNTITTSGSAILTVTTSSAAGGTYPVTVTGTASNKSHIAVVSVTVPAAAAPTFSPGTGTYTTTRNVTLSDTTTGATIYYTTDGSTPTLLSPVYSTPVPVLSSLTIKALAKSATTAPSTIASAAYIINLPLAATPTFLPAAGTYTSAQTVTMADTTAGAAIHYTFDGSTPTATSPVYSTPIAISVTTTVKALATANGYSPSAVSSATYTITGTAATPTFSPAAGTYTAPVSVTLSDATVGAAIHYTLDGSTPTATSPVYSTPIAISATTTVKALATATGYSASAVSSATYTITGTAVAPTFSPAAGTYTAPVSVTLSDTTAGAAIHYTLDGSTPTATSPVYSTPIAVSATTTVRALATATGYTASAVSSATYTITGTAATPTFSPAAGTYTAPVSVTLSDATAGAAIHYTIDGSTPTATSPVYSTPIVISAATTIRALATATGYSASAVSTATYTFSVTATATPTLSPVAGNYTTPQSVTISDTTAGAVVHYTLDGTTPTVTSPTYSVPLTISATATVKALAIAPGFSASAVVSGTYTIAQAITTALTAPTAGATFTAPANITLTATASASAGTITRVEFYNGTTLLGQSLAAPYSYSWVNVPAGSYVLSTTAYGSTGITAKSATVSISVQQTGVNSPTPNAQWNLDSAVAGVTPDATAAHNDATLSGGYSFVTGKIGNSVLFNPASGAALTKTSPFNSAGSFSVATWVYLTENTNGQGFICQPAATGSTFYLELGIPINGKLVFDFDVFPQDSPTANDSIAVGVTAPQINTWYHVVGVYDAVNQQASLYVNGVLESKVSSFPAFANTGGLAFGYSKWMGGRVEPADGRMDDVRAYGIALTPAQVLALYQGH